MRKLGGGCVHTALYADDSREVISINVWPEDRLASLEWIPPAGRDVIIEAFAHLAVEYTTKESEPSFEFDLVAEFEPSLIETNWPDTKPWIDACRKAYSAGEMNDHQPLVLEEARLTFNLGKLRRVLLSSDRQHAFGRGKPPTEFLDVILGREKSPVAPEAVSLETTHGDLHLIISPESATADRIVANVAPDQCGLAFLSRGWMTVPATIDGMHPVGTGLIDGYRLTDIVRRVVRSAGDIT